MERKRPTFGASAASTFALICSNYALRSGWCEPSQSKGEPVISVDTKKKELAGNYKNAGSDYRPQGQPARVNVHDFAALNIAARGVARGLTQADGSD